MSIAKTAANAALGVLLTITVGAAQDSSGFSFALFGDMPYTSAALPDAEVRYQRLIAHMNTYTLGFGVHVGDIKAGSTRCDASVYTRNLELFNTFTAPILYTPGDNEWTDCHRLNNGNFAPLGRLQIIRNTFYTGDYTLGLNPVDVKRQAGYPENARLIRDRVMVITVHMPGSNNNLQQKISEPGRDNPYYDNDAEYAARNAANLAWMTECLNHAKNTPGIIGVVVAFQANPFERFLEPLSASNNNDYIRSGFEDAVSLLRTNAVELKGLGKQMILAHGDTHIMRIGKVLTDTYPGCDPNNQERCVAVPFGGNVIENVTRVEVYAQNNVHWIKVNVDFSNPALFSFEPMLVPGN